MSAEKSEIWWNCLEKQTVDLTTGVTIIKSMHANTIRAYR